MSGAAEESVKVSEKVMSLCSVHQQHFSVTWVFDVFFCWSLTTHNNTPYTSDFQNLEIANRCTREVNSGTHIWVNVGVLSRSGDSASKASEGIVCPSGLAQDPGPAVGTRSLVGWQKQNMRPECFACAVLCVPCIGLQFAWDLLLENHKNLCRVKSILTWKHATYQYPKAILARLGDFSQSRLSLWRGGRLTSSPLKYYSIK